MVKGCHLIGLFAVTVEVRSQQVAMVKVEAGGRVIVEGTLNVGGGAMKLSPSPSPSPLSTPPPSPTLPFAPPSAPPPSPAMPPWQAIDTGTGCSNLLSGSPYYETSSGVSCISSCLATTRAGMYKQAQYKFPVPAGNIQVAITYGDGTSQQSYPAVWIFKTYVAWDGYASGSNHMDPTSGNCGYSRPDPYNSRNTLWGTCDASACHAGTPGSSCAKHTVMYYRKQFETAGEHVLYVGHWHESVNKNYYAVPWCRIQITKVD